MLGHEYWHVSMQLSVHLQGSQSLARSVQLIRVTSSNYMKWWHLAFDCIVCRLVFEVLPIKQNVLEHDFVPLHDVQFEAKQN